MMPFFTKKTGKYDLFIEAHYAHQKALYEERVCSAQYQRYRDNSSEKKLKEAEAKTFKAISKKAQLERDFIDVRVGLYIGLGVELKKLDALIPIYLPWGNLTNHMVYYGTTRFGKTRALASLLEQVIIKGDHVIFLDPKQGANEILSWALDYAHKSNRLKDIAYFSPLFPEMTQYTNPIFGMGDEELTSLILSIQYPNPIPTGNEVFYSGFAEKALMGELRGLNFLEQALDPSGMGVKYKLKKEVKNYITLTKLKGQQFKEYDCINNLMLPDPIDRAFSTDTPDYVDPEHMKYDRTFVTFKELYYYSDFSRMEDIYNSVKTTPIPQGLSAIKTAELEELRGDAKLLLSGIIAKGSDYYEMVSEGYRALLSRMATGRIGKTFCSVRINPFLNRIISDEGLIAIINPNPLKFQRTAEMTTKVIMKMLESMFGTISGTGRMNKRRIWFIIDEGEAVLTPGIQTFLNKAGGLGMSMVIATQSGADFDYKLGPTLARVAKDSINTIVMMKPNDNYSKDEMVETLGTIKAFKSTFMSESGGGAGGRSTIAAEDQYIINATKVDELQVGEAYVKHYGGRYKIITPFVANPADGRYSLKMPLVNEEILRINEMEIERAIKLATLMGDEGGMNV